MGYINQLPKVRRKQAVNQKQVKIVKLFACLFVYVVSGPLIFFYLRDQTQLPVWAVGLIMAFLFVLPFLPFIFKKYNNR